MSIWNKGELKSGVYIFFPIIIIYSQEKDFSLKEYGQFGDIG